MKEFRVYYECLEQGYNYIMPIINGALKGYDTRVFLVRRPKKSNDLNEGSIAAILQMTTPDALITGISDDGKEIPLILVEFTEAVTTEDHELQRTYGAIAAYLSDCYYLKVAGEKQSEKVFGGASYNPYSTPRIFIDKVNYEGYIISKWETEKDNNYTLRRNEEFLSCPPSMDIFNDTITSVVKSFVENDATWYVDSISLLKARDSYKKYRALVDAATGADDLLKGWMGRRDSNMNKLRYFVSDKSIGAKINRFGHAMDPDRGILTFISFLFSENRDVYGVYALVRPRGGDLLKSDLVTLQDMKRKTVAAIKKDGGIPFWFQDELIKAAKRATSLSDIIDFQYVWEKHMDEIADNKVVMTLAFFLDGIKLNYNGITLKWDKRALLNTRSRNFIPAFAKKWGFSFHNVPTKIKRIDREVDEDEVTYAIVHRVLRPAGFNIISISYPGAQGGNAVLPHPEAGKAQERIYPDVIATVPGGSSIDVLINESKGMFSREVEQDIKKVLMFKNDDQYRRALKETLFVARVVDRDKELRNIVVGVSFGADRDQATTWNPGSVDFIFRITERTQWAIGIFKQDLRDLINTISGNTDFPAVYVCDK